MSIFECNLRNESVSSNVKYSNRFELVNFCRKCVQQNLINLIGDFPLVASLVARPRHLINCIIEVKLKKGGKLKLISPNVVPSAMDRYSAYSHSTYVLAYACKKKLFIHFSSPFCSALTIPCGVW